MPQQSVARALAQHFVLAGFVTILFLGLLLQRDGRYLLGLIESSPQAFVPLGLLSVGFFGLFACAMLASWLPCSETSDRDVG